MDELDRLRNEAEQLKSVIKVRESSNKRMGKIFSDILRILCVKHLFLKSDSENYKKHEYYTVKID